jgi:hypothetical protein
LPVSLNNIIFLFDFLLCLAWAGLQVAGKARPGLFSRGMGMRENQRPAVDLVQNGLEYEWECPECGEINNAGTFTALKEKLGEDLYFSLECSFCEFKVVPSLTFLDEDDE